MAESKKYYWLKLKEDFFDDDTISYIEEQENGIYYVNFYLKLCLKSLKNDGKLIRLIGETLLPYDVNSLSKLTGVPVDTVRIAMTIFEKIGLVKIMETGEIYISQIGEMIGKETDKAAIMRRKRAENKMIGNNVTGELPKCYTEIEKEKEIDKEIELEIEKEIDSEPEQKNRQKNLPLSTIVDAYHSICVSFPKVRTLTENRKKALNARLRTGYTLEDFQRLFEMAERSDFLKGKNNRNWSADFDWLIKDANMAKVLEGKYENKERSVDSGTNQGYVPSGKFAKYNGLEL